MLNAIRCIDHRFVFKNSGIACLALMFNLSYLKSTMILHPKKQFKTVQVIWRVIFRSFLDIWYKYMAEWLRLVLCLLFADMGSISAWWWILLPLHCHFALHWASQCTETWAFYIAALSKKKNLGFRQWLSRSDRVLTLNMNIRLPLFWSTWSRALCQDAATYAGLAHGHDYSYCRAWDLSLWAKMAKSLAFVFPWIVENTWKTRATLEGFSNLIPQNVKLHLSCYKLYNMLYYILNSIYVI